MNRIKIPAIQGFVPQLKEVLGALPGDLCRDLAWRVLDIYGVGSTTLGSVPALEVRVDAAVDPIVVDWGQLVQFAAEVFDLFDLKVVGYVASETMDPPQGLESENYQIGLHLLDSSYWSCLYRNPRVGEALSQRFPP